MARHYKAPPRRITAVAFAPLFLLAAPGARAASPGLFLVGGAGSPDEPPTVTFAAGASPETVVTATEGMWQLRREGSAEVSLDEFAAALPATEATGEVHVESLSVAGVPQWHLWNLDTFDTPGTGVWSVDARSVCAAPGDTFLGGHCKLGGASTGRTYTELPPHTHVKVTARVHYFDEWNGEDITLALDSNVVWAQAHAWCPGFLTWKCLKFGIDSCGRDTPDRLSVRVEATVPHTAATLGLVFASGLAPTADPCRVSWGVDDVAVELLTQPQGLLAAAAPPPQGMLAMPAAPAPAPAGPPQG